MQPLAFHNYRIILRKIIVFCKNPTAVIAAREVASLPSIFSGILFLVADSSVCSSFLYSSSLFMCGVFVPGSVLDAEDESYRGV